MCRRNRRNKMHGKATLILTDKNTGRIVKQIEEHNMVTNALSGIFSLPPQIAYSDDSRYVFKNFLPMYTNVLKGLVLFSDNIPENAYSYILGGKYSVLATAGDAYSGADAMRGSFNENQSCEIDNGYRFVWDFAPEKAVGTIKALSLTNRFLGNRGNLSLEGAESPYVIHASDAANGNYYASAATLLSGTGNFFLQKGTNTLYSYLIGDPFIEILQYRIADPLALKICDTVSGVLEKQTRISLNFTTSSSHSRIFYDTKTERLYCAEYEPCWIENNAYLRYRYAVINPVTCEKYFESDYIMTSVPYYSYSKFAFYDGKMYVSDSALTIYVCSLSGEIEKTINLGLNAINDFLIIDGKLAVDCQFTSSGRRCIYIFDEPNTLLMQHPMGYTPIPTETVKHPYCLVTNGNTVYIMLRTDYLATINNLSAPLEKTDQHALQVRYEITN